MSFLTEVRPAAGGIGLQLWSTYEAVLAGLGPDDAALARTAKDARTAGLPELACDATTMRALRHLVHQELSLATQLARTASRMARTESLLGSECFANVVLARARRLNGETHRATRILGAMLHYAPTPFRPWIEWESLLAGAASWPADESSNISRAAASDAERLGGVLSAARAGHVAEYAASMQALSAALGSHVLPRLDVAALRVALEPAARLEGAPRDVLAWRKGAVHDLPWGLAGLSSSAAPVFVACAGGDSEGVRILDVGAPLARSTYECLQPTPGTQQRTDCMLAILGLAGPSGLPVAELFARTYGFPFVRGTHQGVFDVLVHRARARLGGLGSIERVGESYSLRVVQPLLVPDPRSGAHDDDRVLRLVAVRGTLTARDASTALGVSLRKAQLALDALAETGACVQVRRGRHFEYRIEDTTFQEPTHVVRGPL